VCSFTCSLRCVPLLNWDVNLDCDGYLWADDIQVMDLSRVQLVILSGCNTGKGKVSADGVAGLPRCVSSFCFDIFLLSVVLVFLFFFFLKDLMAFFVCIGHFWALGFRLWLYLCGLFRISARLTLWCTFIGTLLRERETRRWHSGMQCWS